MGKLNYTNVSILINTSHHLLIDLQRKIEGLKLGQVVNKDLVRWSQKSETAETEVIAADQAHSTTRRFQSRFQGSNT